MLPERNEGEISEAVRKFIGSREEDGITIFPLSDSELLDDKFNVVFCAAGFVRDERGEKIDFVTFTADGRRETATKFHREIFEWGYGEGTSGVDDIEGWLMAAHEAYFSLDPLFAISFGEYANSGKRAVFIHAKNGVSQNSAVNILKRFSETNLFGSEFKVDF